MIKVGVNVDHLNWKLDSEDFNMLGTNDKLSNDIIL